MGNTVEHDTPVISPKIKNAIKAFKDKLNQLESAKQQRAVLLECKVPASFGDTFELNSWIHIARYALSCDPSIAQHRQHLVPSLIKEVEFWKRYFYLVLQLKRRTKSAQKKQQSTDEKEHSEVAQPEAEAEQEEDEHFQVLLHFPYIWLYRIAPTVWRGRSNKCEDWSLKQPLWFGRLRIVALRNGRHLEFQCLEKDGAMFLKSCRIPLDEITSDDADDANPMHRYFDAYGVVDSSR